MKNETSSNIYIWGALLGLVIGLLSAHLYSRAVTENGGAGDESPALSVGSMIKLGLLLLGVVRQIAELGAETGKNSN